MQNPIKQRYSSTSSTRVLSFPEKTAEAGGALTLSQIAETVEMTLPTAYRFLYTFQAIDLIEKEPDPKVYGISPIVLRPGYGAFKLSMLWNYAHPHLVRASQECGETSNLAVPEKVMSFTPIGSTPNSSSPSIWRSDRSRRLAARPWAAYFWSGCRSKRPALDFPDAVDRSGNNREA